MLRIRTHSTPLFALALVLSCAACATSVARDPSTNSDVAQAPHDPSPNASSDVAQDSRDHSSNTASAAEPSAQSAVPQDVVDAIAKHAVAIATLEPGHGFADLRALKESIGGARVVALGDAAPGARELFQWNRRVFELLAGDGFRVLAADVGWAESLAVDEYVLRGTGDPKAALEALRSPAWSTGEALDLVQWMRAWNADEKHRDKLRFAGLDVQATRGAYLFALDYLQRVDPESAERMGIVLAAFRQVDEKGRPRYASLDADMRNASHAAVQDTLALLEDSKEIYVKKTSEAEWALAKQAAVILSQAEEMYGAATSDEATNAREHALAENALWILKREPSGTRVAVWVANVHVNDEREPVRRMGSHLREKLARELFVIGSVFGHGAARTIDGNAKSASTAEVKLGAAPEDSVEAAFARAKVPLALLLFADLPKDGRAAQWMSVPQAMRASESNATGAQASTVRVAPSKAFDALVFIDAVTAEHSLVSAPAQSK
jgi:erythromycin esterase